MKVLVLLALLPGCVLERSLAMPDPLPVGDAPQHPHRWAPGTTSVRFTGYPFQRVRWRLAREQLQARLSKSLEAEASPSPAYLVDTAVTVQEDSAPNGYTMLGIFGGMAFVAAGAALGTFVPRADGVGPGAWPAVGAGLGLIPALLCLYLFPTMTWKSVLTGSIAVRRASDGFVVARSVARAEWEDDVRSLGAEELLAAESGPAAARLERELRREIAVTLARLDSPR